MIELDARLDHNGDNPRPRAIKPSSLKDRLMCAQRRQRVLRPGHFQFRQILSRATGHGNFRADNIDWRLPARCLPGIFGGGNQPGSTTCDGILRQRYGITSATHRAVGMNLAKAGGNIGRDHHLSLGHGGIGWQMRPRIGPQMVAAQQYPPARQPHLVGYAKHELAKIVRRHSRIAAILIDLVAGRFDQRDRPLRFKYIQQRRFDDQRMGRTHRNNTAGLAALVTRDQIEHGLHWETFHNRCCDCLSNLRSYAQLKQ